MTYTKFQQAIQVDNGIHATDVRSNLYNFLIGADLHSLYFSNVPFRSVSGHLSYSLIKKTKEQKEIRCSYSPLGEPYQTLAILSINELTGEAKLLVHLNTLEILPSIITKTLCKALYMLRGSAGLLSMDIALVEYTI